MQPTAPKAFAMTFQANGVRHKRFSAVSRTPRALRSGPYASYSSQRVGDCVTLLHKTQDADPEKGPYLVSYDEHRPSGSFHVEAIIDFEISGPEDLETILATGDIAWSPATSTAPYKLDNYLGINMSATCWGFKWTAQVRLYGADAKVLEKEDFRAGELGVDLILCEEVVAWKLRERHGAGCLVHGDEPTAGASQKPFGTDEVDPVDPNADASLMTHDVASDSRLEDFAYATARGRARARAEHKGYIAEHEPGKIGDEKALEDEDRDWIHVDRPSALDSDDMDWMNGETDMPNEDMPTENEEMNMANEEIDRADNASPMADDEWDEVMERYPTEPEEIADDDSRGAVVLGQASSATVKRNCLDYHNWAEPCSTTCPARRRGSDSSRTLDWFGFSDDSDWENDRAF